MLGENAPRNATIHEYLDWTATAVEAKDETEYVSELAAAVAVCVGWSGGADCPPCLCTTASPPPCNPPTHTHTHTGTHQTASTPPPQDFSGFRIVLLYPRERNMWPAPNSSQPQPKADPRLGAPNDPWPGLMIKGRPLTAATIRSGPGYLEVPFVATHENKRGRGFGRCIVEAIEDISRALGIGRLLLCSTCEEHVQSTWKHLGFSETSELDLEALDVRDPDLVHMQVCGGVGVGSGGVLEEGCMCLEGDEVAHVVGVGGRWCVAQTTERPKTAISL